LCSHTCRPGKTFQWILTGEVFQYPTLRIFEYFPTLFHQIGGGISCPQTPRPVENFQWILTGGYFITPHLRIFDKFPTLFHQRGGFAPPHLSSRGKFPVDSHGGYFCAPQALHHRDILLSSRAIFTALRKDIHEYCVFDMPPLLLSVETWFRLNRGCCGGRVKNCILRKVDFRSHRLDACVRYVE